MSGLTSGVGYNLGCKKELDRPYLCRALKDSNLLGGRRLMSFFEAEYIARLEGYIPPTESWTVKTKTA